MALFPVTTCDISVAKRFLFIFFTAKRGLITMNNLVVR